MIPVPAKFDFFCGPRVSVFFTRKRVITTAVSVYRSGLNFLSFVTTFILCAARSADSPRLAYSGGSVDRYPLVFGSRKRLQESTFENGPIWGVFGCTVYTYQGTRIALYRLASQCIINASHRKTAISLQIWIRTVSNPDKSGFIRVFHYRMAFTRYRTSHKSG